MPKKTKAYLDCPSQQRLYRLGIGDVSLPLCDAVIQALHQAVDHQAQADTFHGYMPECGAPFLREAVSGYYAKRGVEIDPEEVFISSGASDELGDILDLFAPENSAVIMEPAYPAYVDASIIAGREIIHLASGEEKRVPPAAGPGLPWGLDLPLFPQQPHRGRF